jgi:hypothetical protein
MGAPPEPGDREVSRAWLEWAAENLVRGARPAEIEAALVEEGASAEEARRVVAGLDAAALLGAAQRTGRQAAQGALVLRLLDAARGAAPSPPLPRRPWPGREEFEERYWAGSTPVVFTDLVSRWPAMQAWTPRRLVERFGDAQVDVAVGRSRDPDYDQHTERHTVRMTLRRFVAEVQAAGESNDLYMVANHRNLLKELGPVLEDVALPADVFRTESLARGAAFWLGPAGTVTPLHHDTSNILFCQVIGQKRFRLVAPTETRLFDGARAMYAAVDPERPDHERFPWWPEVREIVDVIAPGEALFLPVGWWHHVRALDLSVSLAVNAFRRPNTFDWYVPGSLGAGLDVSAEREPREPRSGERRERDREVVVDPAREGLGQRAEEAAPEAHERDRGRPE